MDSAFSGSDKIRVGFDDQIFVAQARGGISKYFVELVSRLPKYGIEPVILSKRTRNLHLAESGLVPSYGPDTLLKDKMRGYSWRATGFPRTQIRPRKAQIDLLHFTFTLGPYLRTWRGPSVVTVFDMIPEVYPEYFPMGNPHFAKKRFCDQVDRIISISKSTTNDMLRLFGGQLSSKTVEIPFGVGEQFLLPRLSRPKNELELPDKYLLFVGVRRGYKHFDDALEAFHRLAQQDPQLHLVVVGGGPFAPAEEESIRSLKLSNRIVKIAPEDSQMPEVYRRAQVFVFPSVYEGFGLPTLEALASGTPTVLADASCSREVGGDIAQYFSPGDIDQLVTVIAAAMTPESKNKVKSQGLRRAESFSWDSVARETAGVYRELLDSIGR